MMAPERRHEPSRKRSWFHPLALLRGLSFQPKLYAAVAVAGLVILLLPGSWPMAVRAVSAWSAGAVTYLSLAFVVMSTCTTNEIRQRAAREDETRFVFFAIVLLSVASSFAAVVNLIGDAKSAAGVAKTLYFALAGTAILASWLVTQVVFTLHYAHDYYAQSAGGSGDVKGLDFPGGDVPDYWDFFYFTTSIGATSQTSDVAITSKRLRRLAAVQAVLSFMFNTTIVALAINLAASLL